MSVHAPIERLTHDVLRAAVLELKESEHRRRFPAYVHAGLPGTRTSHRCRDVAVEDAGLRCDVALALLERAGRTGRPHFCWLTRPGAHTVHENDLHWAAAVDWAASALSSPARLVVVTPHGWFDPRTQVARHWRRLRRHSPDPSWPDPSWPGPSRPDLT